MADTNYKDGVEQLSTMSCAPWLSLSRSASRPSMCCTSLMYDLVVVRKGGNDEQIDRLVFRNIRNVANKELYEAFFASVADDDFIEELHLTSPLSARVGQSMTAVQLPEIRSEFLGIGLRLRFLVSGCRKSVGTCSSSITPTLPRGEERTVFYSAPAAPVAGPTALNYDGSFMSS